MYIARSQLTEVGPARLAADASDLGWRPGQWPKQVIVGSHTYNQTEFQVSEGDLMWVLYTQLYGTRTIKVFND